MCPTTSVQSAVCGPNVSVQKDAYLSLLGQTLGWLEELLCRDGNSLLNQIREPASATDNLMTIEASNPEFHIRWRENRGEG